MDTMPLYAERVNVVLGRAKIQGLYIKSSQTNVEEFVGVHQSG
jgi:hypothetical protein